MLGSTHIPPDRIPMPQVRMHKSLVLATSFNPSGCPCINGPLAAVHSLPSARAVPSPLPHPAPDEKICAFRAVPSLIRYAHDLDELYLFFHRKTIKGRYRILLVDLVDRSPVSDDTQN